MSAKFSQNSYILDDFLFILDMYFKHFICSLSHKKFSAKFSSLKADLFFLIFEDKTFTVCHNSLPYKIPGSTVCSKKMQQSV